MKNRIYAIFIVLGIAALTACAPIIATPPLETSAAPDFISPSLSPTSEMAATPPVMVNPTEISSDRGGVYIESYAIKPGGQENSISIDLTGNLPTPCHQIHVAAGQPDAQNRLNIDVYATAKSGAMCAQVLAPFEYTLDVTPLADGEYTLYINEEKMEIFRVPFVTP